MNRHGEIARALDALREEGPEGAAGDAAAAFGWLVGEEGPEALSEARLQEFLWYVLPTKFLVPVEDRLAVAGSLARALDLLGLPRYAALCRSSRTEEVLRAWQESDEAGREAARRAISSSVVEPPDCGDLRWGAIMGGWELRAGQELSAALEVAAEAGALARGGRGWREAQQGFAWRWLNSPQQGFEPLTPYERVVRERLEAWAGRGPARRGLLEPLVERLVPPVSPPEDVDAVVGGLRWFLLRVRTGVGLTATGNLNRDFIRRMAREMGWRPSGFFEPSGEDDVPPLRELHLLARSLRAVRRSGRKEALTRKGAEWVTDAEGLWRAVARQLAEGERWEAAVAGLALAVLLTRPGADAPQVAEAIAPALVEAGWRRRGRSPGADPGIEPGVVEAAVWALLRRADVLGMLQRPPWSGGRILLTDAGRTTAMEALRTRGIAPRTRP